jgi:hypothetical protein
LLFASAIITFIRLFVLVCLTAPLQRFGIEGFFISSGIGRKIGVLPFLSVPRNTRHLDPLDDKIFGNIATSLNVRALLGDQRDHLFYW